MEKIFSPAFFAAEAHVSRAYFRIVPRSPRVSFLKGEDARFSYTSYRAANFAPAECARSAENKNNYALDEANERRNTQFSYFL